MLEDGEIKVYDDENYILADSLFEFKWDSKQSINWRNISCLQFDPATGLLNKEDATRDILQNLDQIATVDLQKERNTRWISEEGRNAMTVMQLGMQYFKFAQKVMRNKVEVLHQYVQTQDQEVARLRKVLKKEKSKHKAMLEFDELMNEQAMQFEILIHKTRLDLLEKMRSRPDVKFAARNPMQASRDVLDRQGLLRGGQTVLFDQITGTRSNEPPS